MSNQELIDINFPDPEGSKKQYYKITFHEINEKNGKISYKLIAGQYISLNCLESVKYFADPYLILFGNPLNIQNTIKEEGMISD